MNKFVYLQLRIRLEAFSPLYCWRSSHSSTTFVRTVLVVIPILQEACEDVYVAHFQEQRAEYNYELIPLDRMYKCSTHTKGSSSITLFRVPCILYKNMNGSLLGYTLYGYRQYSCSIFVVQSSHVSFRSVAHVWQV